MHNAKPRPPAGPPTGVAIQQHIKRMRMGWQRTWPSDQPQAEPQADAEPQAEPQADAEPQGDADAEPEAAAGSSGTVWSLLGDTPLVSASADEDPASAAWRATAEEAAVQRALRKEADELSARAVAKCVEMQDSLARLHRLERAAEARWCQQCPAHRRRPWPRQAWAHARRLRTGGCLRPPQKAFRPPTVAERRAVER